MEHERDGYDLADLAQSVKIQFRDAFVDAVSCTDGNCQGGNACALCEFLCLLWICVRILISAVQVVFFSADFSELSLNADAGRSACCRNAACEGDVILEGLVGSVDHDGCVSCAECLHSQLKAAAVVKVHRNRDACALSRCLYHSEIIVKTRIFYSGRRCLHDDRRIHLLGSLDDCHDHFHVFHIESADCVVAFLCLF